MDRQMVEWIDEFRGSAQAASSTQGRTNVALMSRQCRTIPESLMIVQDLHALEPEPPSPRHSAARPAAAR